MHTIHHILNINAPAELIFKAISTPEGLDKWWTLQSQGTEGLNEEYQFYFGKEFDWRGRVIDYVPGINISFELTLADEDWTGTIIHFKLRENNGQTELLFSHQGWKEDNEHYKRSDGCWLNYLKILKLNVEKGEFIPYEKRNEPI